jgi:hypothetical protein
LDISAVDIIGKGISTVIACFMQFNGADIRSNLTFCLFLLDEANFCADIIPQNHIVELKLYLLSFAFRYLEEVEFDEAVTQDFLKLCRGFFKLIESCSLQSFCHDCMPVQNISLFESCLVSLSLVGYAMTQTTWELFEKFLWESLLGTEYNHLWVFVIECIALLAENGVEFLISNYVCNVIPKLLANGQFLHSHIRLSHLSDSLMKVSRKYQILLQPEDVSGMIQLPMGDRALVISKLNMIQHQFFTGLIWNCLPEQTIIDLVKNINQLWSQEVESFSKDSLIPFQTLYLLINPIISLQKNRNSWPKSVHGIGRVMMKSFIGFLSRSKDIIENLDQSRESINHVILSLIIGPPELQIFTRSCFCE